MEWFKSKLEIHLEDPENATSKPITIKDTYHNWIQRIHYSFDRIWMYFQYLLDPDPYTNSDLVVSDTTNSTTINDTSITTTSTTLNMSKKLTTHIHQINEDIIIKEQ